MLHLSHEPEENRLLRMGYGAASPLWAPFLLMAGVGVGFWFLTGWTRRALAGADGPLGGAGVGHSTSSPPAADPNLDPSKLNAPEQFMSHNPPPAEMPTESPDTAPDPAVPPEHVLDHTPADTVNAPANPAVERKLESARRYDPEQDTEEPGGEAGMVGETASALNRSSATFNGDVRADKAAEPTPVLEDAGDDGSDMVDAAYAANFGPVPTLADGGATPGGKPRSTRSRKRKVAPGTPPEG